MNTFGAQLQPARVADADLLRLDLDQVDEHGLVTSGPVGVLGAADEERLFVILWHRRQRKGKAPAP